MIQRHYPHEALDRRGDAIRLQMAQPVFT